MLRSIPDVSFDPSKQHPNAMGAAASPPSPHDHSSDWLDELRHLTATADSLPAAARRALLATIDAFHAEDSLLPQQALDARTVLAATLDKPHTPASPPALVETLLEAVKRHGLPAPSLGQAHAS